MGPSRKDSISITQIRKEKINYLATKNAENLEEMNEPKYNSYDEEEEELEISEGLTKSIHRASGTQNI